MGVGRDQERQEENGRGPREKDQHTVCMHGRRKFTSK